MSQPVETEKPTRFFWKGVRVKESVYRKRKQQSDNATEINKRGTKREASNLEIDDQSSRKYANIEGRRIVHIKTLAEQLICLKCQNVLSLLDIVSEKSSGSASIFHVQCRICEFVNRVVTDTQHIVNHKPRFDCNTKIVAGAFNAGIGHSHLNKILAALNIPEFYWNTFKTYEREVGHGIELIAEKK